MMNYAEKPTGCFQERDYKRWFTYRPTSDPFAIQNGLQHEIDVLDGVRYAQVKKAVAYVAIDEDEYGRPVLQRWDISKHEFYVN